MLSCRAGSGKRNKHLRSNSHEVGRRPTSVPLRTLPHLPRVLPASSSIALDDQVIGFLCVHKVFVCYNIFMLPRMSRHIFSIFLRLISVFGFQGTAFLYAF